MKPLLAFSMTTLSQSSREVPPGTLRASEPTESLSPAWMATTPTPSTIRPSASWSTTFSSVSLWASLRFSSSSMQASAAHLGAPSVTTLPVYSASSSTVSPMERTSPPPPQAHEHEGASSKVVVSKLLHGEWVVENTCVTYAAQRPIFAKATQRQEPVGDLLVFTEYKMRFESYRQPAGQMPRTCMHVTEEKAFMVTSYQVMNLFHGFHHAVPLSYFFHRIPLTLDSNLLVLPMAQDSWTQYARV